jgi:hypothetical protein
VKLRQAGLVAGLAVAAMALSAGVRRSDPSAHNYHVSPAGSPSGSGSSSSPWDLATALSGAGGRITGGDTVWVHGGTYRGSFNSSVAGNAGTPVVIRRFRDERAIIDGRGTAHGGSILHIAGEYTVFWGLEITNSDPDRSSASTSTQARPNAISTYAAHVKLIDLVVHDAGVGVYTEPEFGDIEISGGIFFNNGWQGPDRGHGHGLYLKSLSGPIVARDNVLFNQFGYGIHVYTNAATGQLNNIRLEGNVAFNNGTQASGGGSSNILVGGEATATGDVIQDNATWFPPSVAFSNVQVGRGQVVNGDIQISGNTFVGGAPVLEMGYWTSAAFSNNTFAGSGNMIALNNAAPGGTTWNGDVFHREAGANAWRLGTRTMSFGAWQSAVSATPDRAGVALPATPTVIVRKSGYDPGRAIVVVYNWPHARQVEADVSGVLSSGDRYEVRNVQDWFGQPVASGTFNGTLSLPMSGVAPPAPVGMAESRAPRTGPDFDVFVILKK